MNIRFLFYISGVLLVCLAGTLLIPILFSFYFKDGAAGAFALSAIITGGTGAILLFTCKTIKDELSVREGFAVVTFTWSFFCLFGALPFVFSGAIPSLLDACFETMSGFTTTGATILDDIETIAESVLLWRSLTQWLGGMGFIVLSLAILPMLGVGGMQLFRAEVPGPTADRLKPRIQDTAKLLWGVYVLLTFMETLLLMAGGMDFFQALNHSFTTMSSGGFSTLNASVGGFDSAFIDGVITFFMFLAGVNFAMHYQALRGRPKGYFQNEEFLFYLFLLIGAISVMTAFNYGSVYGSFWESLRYSAFQATSILTTTGYVTADYETWSVLILYVLVFLMFVGGCAGSTAGGMKIARVLLLFKHAQVQLYRMIHPRAVRLVKLGDAPVNQEVMQSILGFFALYIGVFVIASFLMAASGMDVVSAGASVVATLGNVGPGIGSVGAVDTYSHIAPFGKGVLILCMLMGRLELFTVLVLFFPSTWRR